MTRDGSEAEPEGGQERVVPGQAADADPVSIASRDRVRLDEFLVNGGKVCILPSHRKRDITNKKKSIINVT